MPIHIFHMVLDATNFLVLFWIIYLTYKFFKMLYNKQYDSFFEDYLGYIYPLPFLTIVLVFISLGFGLDLHIFKNLDTVQPIDVSHLLEEIDELCYLMLLVYLNWLFPKILSFPVMEIVITKLRLKCKGEWTCQLNR